jgi:hypothetical protein
MAENKTQPTAASVAEFLAGVANDKRRADAIALNNFLTTRTGLEPVMWGTIVGFGTLHYKYETGREGDTMLVGFAPRSTSLVLYGLSHELSDQLGQHTLGKGCIYVKDLDTIDLGVLGRMVDTAIAA